MYAYPRSNLKKTAFGERGFFTFPVKGSMNRRIDSFVAMGSTLPTGRFQFFCKDPPIHDLP